MSTIISEVVVVRPIRIKLRNIIHRNWLYPDIFNE